MSALKALVALMTQKISRSYATWNPADKSAYVILSGGNLTISSSSAPNYANIRSTISKTSGKWYWETTYSATFNASSSGVCTSSHALNNAFIGNSVGAESGFFSSGGIYVSGSSMFASSFLSGDIIGHALDADAGTLAFYKNGTLIYTATQGVGTVFAAHSAYLTSSTTNFGASAFTYSPPAGYNSGLYI